LSTEGQKPYEEENEVDINDISLIEIKQEETEDKVTFTIDQVEAMMARVKTQH